jgi:hypothetical protein
MLPEDKQFGLLALIGIENTLMLCGGPCGGFEMDSRTNA